MHKLFDLAKGHPAEVRQHLNILIHFDDYITVTLTKETCTLFTLQLIKQHMVRFHVDKIIQICRFFTLMNLRIIALSSL